jgi:hypothetical protein
MSGLLSDTVTRLRAPTITDSYGNQLPDWDNALELSLSCRVQQQQANEDTADRDQQTATFLVFLPPGADVTGSDRLDWHGRLLELLGPPAPVGGYNSTAHHLEARAGEVIG